MSMTQTNSDNSNNLTSVLREDLDQSGHHPGGLNENILRSQLPSKRTAKTDYTGLNVWV